MTTTPAAGRPGTVLVGRRPGSRPQTTPRTPHYQLDQYAPPALQAELWLRMLTLAGVVAGHSLVSVPSSRALHLPAEAARGPADAFMVGTEFAHLHGDGSGSLHLAVPHPLLDAVIAGGWAEPHPAVALGIAPETSVMLYGPRDDTELELAWAVVQASHAYARGEGAAAAREVKP